MVLQFIKFQWRKVIRSVSLSRSIVAGLFLGFVALMVLGYLFLLGVMLNTVITEGLGVENAIYFLNVHLFFFFLFEIGYRFMFQKLPVIELESFLHLPVSKSKIIHYLLVRSFLSPFNIVALLLFTPFALSEIGAAYGATTAFYWLATLILISWTLHWLMLWFKQQYGNKIVGLLIIFVLLGGGIASAWYGWFNLGVILQPVFASSLQNIIPFMVMIALFIASYYLAFSFYKRNAYLEDLSDEEDISLAGSTGGFFSRFGLTGELADLEWKLILRHKKSRTYFFISGLILFYGLIFYGNDAYATTDGLAFFFIFVGVFITGGFILQYGQLFLSWNSSYFDFYLSQRRGAEELIKGKYLLFTAVAVLSFLLTIPYVYYGWNILFLHLATFLFNMGITMHLMTYLALWKPKPMDLSKGAMFNYEGVGIAQFLMLIPMILVPYIIYLPVALIFNWKAGLLALAGTGLLGIIFFRKLTNLAVKQLLNNRYKISASFRGET